MPDSAIRDERSVQRTEQPVSIVGLEAWSIWQWEQADSAVTIQADQGSTITDPTDSPIAMPGSRNETARLDRAYPVAEVLLTRMALTC